MDSTGHSNKKIRKMEEEEAEFSDSEVPPPLPIQFQADTNFTADLMEPQEFQKMQHESHARLRTLLEVAGVSDLDPQTFSDPEILRRLTSSVSNALDEAASALTKMKQESNQSVGQDAQMKLQEAQATNVAIASVAQAAGQLQDDASGNLSDACNQGDIRAVQKLLGQG